MVNTRSRSASLTTNSTNVTQPTVRAVSKPTSSNSTFKSAASGKPASAASDKLHQANPTPEALNIKGSDAFRPDQNVQTADPLLPGPLDGSAGQPSNSEVPAIMQPQAQLPLPVDQIHNGITTAFRYPALSPITEVAEPEMDVNRLTLGQAISKPAMLLSLAPEPTNVNETTETTAQPCSSAISTLPLQPLSTYSSARDIFPHLKIGEVQPPGWSEVVAYWEDKIFGGLPETLPGASDIMPTYEPASTNWLYLFEDAERQWFKWRNYLEESQGCNPNTVSQILHDAYRLITFLFELSTRIGFKKWDAAKSSSFNIGRVSEIVDCLAPEKLRKGAGEGHGVQSVLNESDPITRNIRNAIMEFRGYTGTREYFKSTSTWKDMIVTMQDLRHADGWPAISKSFLNLLAKRTSPGKTSIQTSFPAFLQRTNPSESVWKEVFTADAGIIDRVYAAIDGMYYLPLAPAYICLRNIALLLERISKTLLVTDEDGQWNGMFYEYYTSCAWQAVHIKDIIQRLAPQSYPDYSKKPLPHVCALFNDDLDASDSDYVPDPPKRPELEDKASDADVETDAGSADKHSGQKTNRRKSKAKDNGKSQRQKDKMKATEENQSEAEAEPEPQTQSKTKKSSKRKKYMPMTKDHNEFCAEFGDRMLQELRSYATTNGLDMWDCLQKAGLAFSPGGIPGLIERSLNGWNVFARSKAGTYKGMSGPEASRRILEDFEEWKDGFESDEFSDAVRQLAREKPGPVKTPSDGVKLVTDMQLEIAGFAHTLQHTAVWGYSLYLGSDPGGAGSSQWFSSHPHVEQLIHARPAMFAEMVEYFHRNLSEAEGRAHGVMESHLLDNTASAQPLHLRTTAVQTAKAKTALITTDEPVSKTKNKRYQLVSSCTAICTNTIQVALRKNVVEMFATALTAAGCDAKKMSWANLPAFLAGNRLELRDYPEGVRFVHQVKKLTSLSIPELQLLQPEGFIIEGNDAIHHVHFTSWPKDDRHEKTRGVAFDTKNVMIASVGTKSFAHKASGGRQPRGSGPKQKLAKSDFKEIYNSDEGALSASEDDGPAVLSAHEDDRPALLPETKRVQNKRKPSPTRLDTELATKKQRPDSNERSAKPYHRSRNEYRSYSRHRSGSRKRSYSRRRRSTSRRRSPVDSYRRSRSRSRSRSRRRSRSRTHRRSRSRPSRRSHSRTEQGRRSRSPTRHRTEEPRQKSRLEDNPKHNNGRGKDGHLETLKIVSKDPSPEYQRVHTNSRSARNDDSRRPSGSSKKSSRAPSYESRREPADSHSHRGNGDNRKPSESSRQNSRRSSPNAEKTGELANGEDSRASEHARPSEPT